MSFSINFGGSTKEAARMDASVKLDEAIVASPAHDADHDLAMKVLDAHLARFVDDESKVFAGTISAGVGGEYDAETQSFSHLDHALLHVMVATQPKPKEEEPAKD